MEEYYAECRKPHQKLQWNFDGCQEFIPTGRHGYGLTTCRICDCHQSHHRRVLPKVKKVVVEHTTAVVYTICQKIHHHNSVDGCQEFLLDTTDMEEPSCANCGCRKSFHRNVITTSTTTTTTTSLS